MGRIDYYAAVARHVPPSELAKGAARRALRLAQKALYRRRAADAFAGTLGALDRRSGSGWCEPSQREGISQALSRTPAARERAIARADRAVRRDFDVFGTTASFGVNGPTDWSLDVVSGHRYPLVPAAELSLLKGGADPKFAWVLGRLDQLIALAQGYLASEDAAARARYAQTFFDELSDFVRANPVGMGVHWTCPMEVSLRAANIAQALVAFSDAPVVRQDGFVSLVLTALAQHAAFVEAHLEDDGFVPNNHLVANYAGLLVVAALFPELPNAARQLALAAHGLRSELQAQVHEDGTSFEGSIPYHRLSVELFGLGYLFARGYGVDLGGAYAERLLKMFKVTAAYVSEQGLAPQLGDNDSGRALPFTDRASLDHGYLPSLGAALFGEPELKTEGAELCDEALWLLGETGAARFERLPAMAKACSWVSQPGGWANLRGGGAVLTASIGSNGQRGIGGHSHNDKLSFELHVDGVPVIVDPGSPTYTRDPALRNQFRATAAHSTLELDGHEQSPIDPARLFALPDRAAATVELFWSSENAERLTASHAGYDALPSPVEHERTWILHKRQHALVVCDVLRANGWHQVVSRLQLPHTDARLRPATEAERMRASKLGHAPRVIGELALEIGPVEQPVAVVLVEDGWRVELASTSYSPGYGQQRPALALVVQRAVNAPARVGMVVMWTGAKRPTER